MTSLLSRVISVLRQVLVTAIAFYRGCSYIFFKISFMLFRHHRTIVLSHDAPSFCFSTVTAISRTELPKNRNRALIV